MHVARQPFGEISPGNIRAIVVPEEHAEFDEGWRAACLAAAETQDLSTVVEFLACCGRRALLVEQLGVNGYRELMARAGERLRTGAEPTGGMSGQQTKAMIAQRLGMTVEELSAMVAERLRNRL
jgi:hypothetical protein